MSISTHRRAAGVRYEVRLRGPDGRDRSRTFRTRKDAERYEREQRSAMDRGAWIDPTAGRVTLAAWADEWLRTTVHLRPNTQRIYASNFRLHILPTLGEIELRKITPSMLRTWIAGLSVKPTRSGTLSPSSVAQTYRTLNSALNAAVENELIGRNPMAAVKPPREERHEMRHLTAEQVMVLADSIDERYRAFVLVAAFCGLRTGELAGLHWSDVNMLRRRIEVRGQFDGESVVPTKSTAGVRSIAMPRVVIDALATHAEHGCTEAPPAGRVFTAPGGGWLDIDNFRARVWVSAICDADLVGLRIHDLRHTCASVAIAAGADVKVIQQMLGHASAALTLDRYGHLMPGQQDAVADRLDEMLAGRVRSA